MLRNRQEVVSMAFGLWLSALFSNIAGYNPEMDFVMQREAFFQLLRELLEERKIRFLTPNELWQECKDVWGADKATIIQYLISKWPKDAKNEDDLIDYFFEIPAVLWVNDDGSMVGS